MRGGQRAAAHGRPVGDHAVDGAQQVAHVGRAVQGTGTGRQLVGRAAPVRHHQRQAARARLRHDQARRLRLAPVHQHVGAREQARHRVAVDRRGQADVGVARDAADQRRALRPVAHQGQADRAARARRRRRVDDQPPALLGRQPAHAQQQRGPRVQPAPGEQLRAQALVATVGRKAARLHPDRHGARAGQPAGPHPGGERRVAAHRQRELLVQPAQMPPIGPEHPVDGPPVEHAAQPAIGVGGQGVGVHHQHARGRAGPAADHGRAGPGRRRLHQVGGQLVQRGVQRRLVVEVAITAVERKGGGAQRDDRRARSERPDPAHLTRHHHRDPVAQPGQHGQLALDIGPHPAAGGVVEGAHVDDVHHPPPVAGEAVGGVTRGPSRTVQRPGPAPPAGRRPAAAPRSAPSARRCRSARPPGTRRRPRTSRPCWGAAAGG